MAAQAASQAVPAGPLPIRAKDGAEQRLHAARPYQRPRRSRLEPAPIDFPEVRVEVIVADDDGEAGVAGPHPAAALFELPDQPAVVAFDRDARLRQPSFDPARRCAERRPVGGPGSVHAVFGGDDIAPGGERDDGRKNIGAAWSPSRAATISSCGRRPSSSGSRLQYSLPCSSVLNDSETSSVRPSPISWNSRCGASAGTLTRPRSDGVVQVSIPCRGFVPVGHRPPGVPCRVGRHLHLHAREGSVSIRPAARDAVSVTADCSASKSSCPQAFATRDLTFGPAAAASNPSSPTSRVMPLQVPPHGRGLRQRLVTRGTEHRRGGRSRIVVAGPGTPKLQESRRPLDIIQPAPHPARTWTRPFRRALPVARATGRSETRSRRTRRGLRAVLRRSDGRFRNRRTRTRSRPW